MGLLEIGFLDASRGQGSSRYQLIPLAESWVACDFPKRLSEDRPDCVMGIGSSSIVLAFLAPRIQEREADAVLRPRRHR